MLQERYQKQLQPLFFYFNSEKSHPQELRDYHPICLIEISYKILLKLLTSRLKNVISKVIPPCQSIFLPSRNILDKVVVVNEILDLAKRRKDKCLFLKAYFENAYYTVN